MRSGVMRDEIVKALRDAFPDPGDMRSVVELAGIGASFDDYRTAVGTTYQQALDSLIRNYADPQDQLVPLLEAARQKNPRNATLKLVMDKLADLSNQFASLRPQTGFGEAERIVLKGITFEDVPVWIETLKAKRLAVCRVEPQPAAETTAGFGSGFLVAPDVLITNFHVARPFWDDEAKARRVVLRFGYETDSMGIKVSDGVEHRLAFSWRGPNAPEAGQASRPWQVLSSPENRLDYALLRLEKAASTDKIDGIERGFLTPTSWRFNELDPLLILQHPSAAPLKLAFGAVDEPAPPSHVHYQVNTEPGSSGSPCLNQRLETTALHHQGDVSFNRGVTFEAIREDWSARLDQLESQGLSWLANQARLRPEIWPASPAKKSSRSQFGEFGRLAEPARGTDESVDSQPIQRARTNDNTGAAVPQFGEAHHPSNESHVHGYSSARKSLRIPSFHCGSIVPVDYFIDRESELEEARALIESRQSFLLVGRRRAGKTSFGGKLIGDLKTLGATRKGRVLGCSIDLEQYEKYDETSFLANTLLKLIGEVAREVFGCRSTTLTSKNPFGVHPALRQDTAFRNLLDLNHEAVECTHTRGPNSRPTLRTEEFEGFVADLIKIIRDKGWADLLIFYDEANKLPIQLTERFLRWNVEALNKADVVTIYAASPEMCHKFKDWSAQEISIGPFLNLEDMLRLLARYYFGEASLRDDLPVATDAILRIWEISRGSPYLIQHLSHRSFALAGAEAAGRVEGRHVLAAHKDLSQTAPSVFLH